MLQIYFTSDWVQVMVICTMLIQSLSLAPQVFSEHLASYQAKLCRQTKISIVSPQFLETDFKQNDW